MGYIGEGPLPGFSGFRSELEKVHETAEVEFSTGGQTKFKVKRGDIQFGNGTITFPHGGRTVAVPYHAIDHVVLPKA